MEIGDILYHVNPSTKQFRKVEVVKPGNVLTRTVAKDLETGETFEADGYTFQVDEPTDPMVLLKRAIDTHDLTFEYSDDHRAWARGHAQLGEIKSLAKNDPAEATRLWKAKVDRELAENFRESFSRTF